MVNRRYSLIAIAALPAALVAQDAAGRLLPESFTRSLGFKWRQDGRVVEITLDNTNGSWLVTEATFTVVFPTEESKIAPPLTPPKPVTKGSQSGQSALDDLLRQGYRYIIEPESHKVSINLMPTKKISTHIELRSPDPIANLKLDETRGREPSLFERARSKVL